MDIQLLSKAVMYHTVDSNLIFRSPTTLTALFSAKQKKEKPPLLCARINKRHCYGRRSLSMQQVSFTTDLPAE